jgi:Ca2+-transporting ATPase
MKKKFLKAGLTSAQVVARLKKFGRNELRKPREFTTLKILFNQFKSPLIYVLVFAGIVTLFVGDFTDSIVIFAAVILNTGLGFYQERKAQESLEALRGLLAPKTKVIRDGRQQIIEARELVPGDLVVLTIGDRVPADGIVMEGTDLSVNEAILTGEAMPVAKETWEMRNGKWDIEVRSGNFRSKKSKYQNISPLNPASHISLHTSNKVFMGTTIATGIAKMLVTNTGVETEIGKIGKQVAEVKEEKTPTQIQIGKLARVLAITVGGLAVFIFLFGGFLGYELLEMFTTSVAVAVAAIPEGLPVALTVILALGMQRILKRKALVRKLLAVETLGSVSVICADKTGTLTEGKMRVVKAVTEVSIGAHLRGVPGSTPKEEVLVKAAVLCNDMRDPLEVAMLSWAEEKIGGIREIKEIKEEYPRLDEIPFSPKYKYIATLHKSKRVGKQESKNILFLSGAPEVVLCKCKVKSAKLKVWEKKLEEYGGKGYRLVGFAYKNIKDQKSKINKFVTGVIKNEDIKDLQWLGVLLFEDPVREGVQEALEECQRAGIKVKVITGDYPATGMAVLNKLKIKNKKLKITIKNSKMKEIAKDGVVTGEELEEINEKELRQIIDGVVLFARTTPEQKLKIVKALKKKGAVVAMMGDGVNDAPALKQADIGIVVGESSDVARETADMVLLDSNFATIVQAIEEGRSIFENIKKVTLYLLSCSFTMIILIGGSLLFALPLPLTAAQILWINLVQDGFPAMALAFEPKEKELMNEPPRKKEPPILDLPMKILIFMVGIITNLVLFGLVIFSWKGFLPFRFSQTMVFVALGIIFLFILFACRSLRRTIFNYHPFNNPVLIGAVFLSLVLLLMAIYSPPLQVLLKTQPLGAKDWLFLLVLGLFNLLVIEVGKWAFVVKNKK